MRSPGWASPSPPARRARTGSSQTACSATSDDPGWFYEYGDTCPVGAGNCGNLASCKNEKTGSPASIVFGCTVWNGFVPVGAQTGSDPCSGRSGTPLVFGYAANYVSGVPSGACGYSALARHAPLPGLAAGHGGAAVGRHLPGGGERQG